MRVDLPFMASMRKGGDIDALTCTLATKNFIASREIKLNKSVKGQPVLFGAVVCHPEQFFPLISVLPQNRRSGGC